MTAFVNFSLNCRAWSHWFARNTTKLTIPSRVFPLNNHSPNNFFAAPSEKFTIRHSETQLTSIPWINSHLTITNWEGRLVRRILIVMQIELWPRSLGIHFCGLMRRNCCRISTRFWLIITRVKLLQNRQLKRWWRRKVVLLLELQQNIRRISTILLKCQLLTR